MLLVLVWSARDVSLAADQWFWLAVATVLLAGLCSWIISWEADYEPEGSGVAATEDESSAQDDGDAGAAEQSDTEGAGE
jgi:hypothetical protein